MLVQFCKDTETISDNEMENAYTQYISFDKVIKLNEIIQNLPLIINKDKNVSTSIYLAMDSARKTQNEKMMQEKTQRKELDGELLSKHDPYLQKLCELIYSNINSRFQSFGNGFTYFDFKNRQAVSLDDFQRALDGFAIKMSPMDSKSVFAYLTDSDASETVLMRPKQFMKLQEEKKQRNIDVFELQVFQEELSNSLKGVSLKKNFD